MISEKNQVPRIHKVVIGIGWHLFVCEEFIADDAFCVAKRGIQQFQMIVSIGMDFLGPSTHPLVGYAIKFCPSTNWRCIPYILMHPTLNAFSRCYLLRFENGDGHVEREFRGTGIGNGTAIRRFVRRFRTDPEMCWQHHASAFRRPGDSPPPIGPSESPSVRRLNQFSVAASSKPQNVSSIELKYSTSTSLTFAVLTFSRACTSLSATVQLIDSTFFFSTLSPRTCTDSHLDADATAISVWSIGECRTSTQVKGWPWRSRARCWDPRSPLSRTWGSARAPSANPARRCGCGLDVMFSHRRRSTR